jgi:hypothetical protein
MENEPTGPSDADDPDQQLRIGALGLGQDSGAERGQSSRSFSLNKGLQRMPD